MAPMNKFKKKKDPTNTNTIKNIAINGLALSDGPTCSSSESMA